MPSIVLVDHLLNLTEESDVKNSIATHISLASYFYPAPPDLYRPSELLRKPYFFS